jgi:hypothetical protein
VVNRKIRWNYLLNYQLKLAKTEGMTNPEIKAFLVCPSCLDAAGGTPRQSAALGHTKKTTTGWVSVYEAARHGLRQMLAMAAAAACIKVRSENRVDISNAPGFRALGGGFEVYEIGGVASRLKLRVPQHASERQPHEFGKRKPGAAAARQDERRAATPTGRARAARAMKRIARKKQRAGDNLEAISFTFIARSVMKMRP